MSFTQIYIHYVWATRNRRHLLVAPYRQQLFAHIKENALLKKIHLDRINGYTDHVHCLVFLQSFQSVASVAQLLKGESAHWFNSLPVRPGAKLEWQEGYFAASVDLSGLFILRRYLDQQEEHHRRVSFAQEYQKLMKENLLIKDLDNSLDIYKRNTGR